MSGFLTVRRRRKPSSGARRYDAGARREYLRCFRASGLSAEAFTAAEGLKFSMFQRWLRSTPPPPRFREVAVAPLPVASAWDVEVQLASGVTVRLRGELARVLLPTLLA